MAYGVHVEFALRAEGRLYNFSPDIQKGLLARVRQIQKTLAKNIKANGTPPSGTVVIGTYDLDKERDYYRTIFVHQGVDYYITFKWPARTLPQPLPKDFEFPLLIASVGRWAEKFLSHIKKVLKAFRNGPA